MLSNYLTVAWRHLLKNKLYAAINILGLMVGLSVYIFGSLLVEYEENHDTSFERHERIFTVGTVFSPLAAQNVGVGETDGIYSAFGPLIETSVPEIEAVARTVRQEFLLSVDNDQYYENIRFTDSSLLKIFDFSFIAGDSRALEDPSGIVLTRSMAEKLFNSTAIIGETLTLDHDVSLHVTAVIENPPKDTHFNSALFEIGEGGLEILAPFAALNRATDYDVEGNFNNLSMGDLTYVQAPVDKNLGWVQEKIDLVFANHFPNQDQEFIARLKVRPLSETNTVLFDAIGMPILESVQVLAFLVLVVAIVNYTNLATAQSLGRAREVGLRKTMGAAQSQLLVQFMIESLCIVSISMLFALALLEVSIPVYNEAVGRAMSINYAGTMFWILGTTVAVGLISGAYPAYLITRATPIDALNESSSQGVGGGLFRSMMLGLQFTISIFMLAMVMIVFFQNKKVEDASSIYPRAQIVSLQRLGLEAIQARMDTLRSELKNIRGVEAVSFSSQLPFQQSNSSFGAGPIMGDEDSAIMLMNVRTDEHFLDTYKIPLLAGRELNREIAADSLKEGVLELNVLVNEMAADRLGFGSPEAAIGSVFYDFPDETSERKEPRAYTIVGVVPDQNFQGFHNQIKPMTFFFRPEDLTFGSIRVVGVPMDQALKDIEEVWDKLIPDYPMQSEFLDETFAQTFRVYSAMTQVLGGFALVALTLSMIGLFGLAAFMAQARTREIGIRKVMGASTPQIVRLLVWQFSKPVMWALVVALPLAYFASSTYLDFFADRISMPAGIVVGAGVLAVLFSWIIVALHAVRIAKANPVMALRYE